MLLLTLILLITVPDFRIKTSNKKLHLILNNSNNKYLIYTSKIDQLNSVIKTAGINLCALFYEFFLFYKSIMCMVTS